MKHYVTIIICFGLIQLQAFPGKFQSSSKAPNLIINGGFEAGLSNWGAWNNPKIINSDVMEGNWAVKMIEKGSINQTISVKPLTTYLVSGYAKISHSQAKLVFSVEGISSIDLTETTYTKHSIRFTTDEKTTTVKVFFWLPPNVSIGPSLSAFVDAVEMIEIDDTSLFNVTSRTPVNSTQIATTESICLIFNKEVSLETSNGIDVFINKEPSNETFTWSVNSGNTLSLHPNETWIPGSLISLMIKPSAISVDGFAFNGTTSEFKYIVDTENNFGFERIEIPTLVTRNNGTHNIPLKVALPTDRNNPVPVQFWVHGGGWSGGTESDSWSFHGPHSEYLAEELGIATIEIAYRCMGSSGTFAQAMEDIDAAYHWAVDNAENYNLDIENSFFSGGSAGTPLSSLAAQRYPTIKAYVGFNGIYNFVENPGSAWPAPNIYEYCTPSCEANSALFNLRANPPITLLLHGDQDGTINHTQSTLFADAIVNAGGEAKVIIYEGESHAFFNQGRVQYEDCLYEVAKFLNDHDITQSLQTGTEEAGKAKQTEICIWPNPVAESITIKSDKLKGKINALIINSSGQKVLQDSFDIKENMSINLPLYGFSAGYYILNLNNRSGMNFHHKLLLQ